MEDIDKCESTVKWRFAQEIEEPLKPIKDDYNIDLRRAIRHHAERDTLLTI